MGSRFLDALDHNTVRERDGERNTSLWAEVSRDVTLARRVFNQVDVSGPSGDMDASGYFNFRITGERDYKLPCWPGVPPRGRRVGSRGVPGIGPSRGRPHAELRSSGLEHVRRPTGVQVQFNVFGMGQTVRPGEDARD